MFSRKLFVCTQVLALTASAFSAPLVSANEPDFALLKKAYLNSCKAVLKQHGKIQASEVALLNRIVQETKSEASKIAEAYFNEVQPGGVPSGMSVALTELVRTAWQNHHRETLNRRNGIVLISDQGVKSVGEDQTSYQWRMLRSAQNIKAEEETATLRKVMPKNSKWKWYATQAEELPSDRDLEFSDSMRRGSVLYKSAAIDEMNQRLDVKESFKWLRLCASVASLQMTVCYGFEKAGDHVLLTSGTLDRLNQTYVFADLKNTRSPDTELSPQLARCQADIQTDAEISVAAAAKSERNLAAKKSGDSSKSTESSAGSKGSRGAQ